MRHGGDMSASGISREDEYSIADLRQLRLGGIWCPLLIQYVSAVVLIVVPLPVRFGQSIGFGLALVAVAATIFAVHFAHPSLAALLLVAAWFGFWAIMLRLLPADQTAYLGVLVVGAASALLGPLAAVVAAGLVSLTMLRASSLGLVSSNTVMISGFVLWASVGLFWFTAHPVTTCLRWAWASFVDARETRDQLRQRQGELNRALKSLEVAYNRLEHLNDELNRARHAAEDAQRFKSQFAANISHELRTPLNLIIGFSEMMVAMPHTYNAAQLPPAYQADIAAIYHNACHLSDLIDDVLDLSQIEAGRMGLSRGWTDLPSIIEEAVDAVDLRIESMGVTLDVTLAPELPLVYADRTRIRQVLINLLNNAARFTDGGGICIDTKHGDHEVVVSVADTGSGIAPEELTHVFDEFYQSDCSLQRRTGGNGLGLTISKRLVELHGGAMWAESQLGIGSTFTFSLPLLENVVTGTLPGEWEIWDRIRRDHEATKPLLGVLTEDDEVKRAFQRHLDGYRVVGMTADVLDSGSYEAAPLHGAIIAAATANDCWHVLKQAAARKVGLPVAVATVPGNRSQALELGVADALTKPITREKLRAVLRRLGQDIRTILVVDDNVDMVRLLARMIRGHERHYEVFQATGGAEAIQVMGERRPDAVLLDLLMPDVDGYAVLKVMRDDEHLKEVPVVTISAGTSLVETKRVELIGFGMPGGFSIDETMRCFKAYFDLVQSMQMPRNAEPQQVDPPALPA